MTQHLEERLFAYLLFGESAAVEEIEATMPRKARRIDGLLRVGVGGESWGRLRARVTDRLVVVEAYSRPPSIADVAKACTKLAWINEQWHLATIAHGSLPPRLVIFSDGKPRTVLERWPSFRDSSIAGVRRASTPVIGSILLVNTRELPRIHGTSVLRMTAPPRSEAEAHERIEHLLGDDWLSDTFKRRLKEAIVSKSIPASAFERELTYEGAVSEGRREGIREGRREGIREGRREGIREGRREGIREGRREGIRDGQRKALLAIARHLCSDEVLEELEQIEDLETLQDRIVALSLHRADGRRR